MTAQESKLSNAYESTITSALTADASGTTISVDTAPTDSSNTAITGSVVMYLVLDPDSDSSREYVKVTNISGTTLTVTRNIDTGGGGLRTHSAGAKIRQVPQAQHFDDIHDRINTIINEDGTAVVTTGVVKDEDDMTSDSATHLATQQSIKAYVDAQVDTKDTLSELDDVTITSVGDNDIIAYDNSSSKYINQTASEAGLATSAQGALADSATQPSDNISTLTNDSGFITASTTDTLTNKTIDADGTGNSITNIEDANIKSAAAIDASKIADGSVSNAEFQRLDGVTSDIQTQLDGKQASGSYITASSTDTLTNKTIDADGTGNSITNIEDANIKASAAIDASKIADGSVSNAEFQRLDGVTSDIQTQLDAKGDVTASSTTTFTNKTIDANGTGNSISNIEVADLAGSAVVTDTEGIGSNDNDTTLPTSAAVKDYVDTEVSGVTVSTEDVQDIVAGQLVTNGTHTGITFAYDDAGDGAIDATVSVSSDEILDADGDTKIQVEESADEDKIRYDIAGTEVAVQDAGGIALTTNGGIFRHHQTQAATYTVAANEGTLLAGPITITGTVTNNGTMVVI